MKIAVTIEARMTSNRLPGKVLKPVLGRPLLDFMIDRLNEMQTVSQIIVATTINKEDDPIVEVAKRRNVGYFRGSEHDVMGRVLKAAQHYNVDIIVETTADCPLIDPVESDKVVLEFLKSKGSYFSNCLIRSYPRGMDTQVFPTEVLEEVAKITQNPVDREHVAFYIYNHPDQYKIGNLKAPPELTDPDLRLTVDTSEDFMLIKNIIENLWQKNPLFSLKEILNYLNVTPDLRKINQHIQQKRATYASTTQ